MKGARRLLHRAYLRARQGPEMRLLAELERSQWLPAEEIRARQWDRLGALLHHAAAKVPWYRDAFRSAGVVPEDLVRARSLEALPVLTKETIRERRADLISEDAAARGAARNTTGGSTGRPLEFLQDESYRRHRQAVMYRGFRWCGWRPGGSLAYVWGSDVDSRAHRGAGALRDALIGITWVDAFTLEDAAIDRTLERIARSDPDILIGYASSLRHLARRALQRGGGPRLRAIESSAEVLTPEARAEMEAAFHCKVLDRYGCREAGVIAHECGAGQGWHINAETVHIETDDAGSLLVTTLRNYAMPLIRYRNEDLVTLGGGACSCGRGLPLMTKVVGRRSDIILSPSGRAIHGEFFTHLFYDAPGVREFQVVQISPAELVVRVVAGEAFGASHRSRIEAAIRDHADAAFLVRWETLAEIPRGASGKFRFTLSEVAGERGPGDRS